MISFPRPVRDANAQGGADNLGHLPEWDLSDLYKGEDAPELIRDLDWLESACAEFARDYEGKLDTLDAAGLLECIVRDEKISNIAGRIMS
ncbi:MAG TPA: oligoendopeptidase F, partial [Roseovarius nubinhibens]|nr:oligoendopeptidase F [Roseovarius nubinhibens]